MGRVRRYKKYKACDPASKKFGKEIDTKHDEPPELFEQRARKINRDREDRWDDEERREHLLQREALRELRMNEQKDRQKEKKLESKRANESMQAFKARIKQETRKTLVEEVHKMTATAQKRKLRLKERALKRKAKKGGKAGEEKEQVEFFAAEDGRLRPSDLGLSSTSFRSSDPVAFGERAERPPDLQKFTAKFKVAAKDKTGATSGTVGGPSTRDAAKESGGEDSDSQSDSVGDGGDSSAEEEDEPMTKNMRNKKRKARSLALKDRNDLDGDDGLELGAWGGAGDSRGALEALLNRNGRSSSAAGKSDQQGKAKRAKLDSSSGSSRSGGSAGWSAGSPAARVPVGGGVKAQNEMEALRLKVQEAYRQLRDKRRAAQV